MDNFLIYSLVNDIVCVTLKCQDILIVTTNINCFNKENNKN